MICLSKLFQYNNKCIITAENGVKIIDNGKLDKMSLQSLPFRDEIVMTDNWANCSFRDAHNDSKIPKLSDINWWALPLSECDCFDTNTEHVCHVFYEDENGGVGICVSGEIYRMRPLSKVRDGVILKNE